jgi:large subunit ribosomal protein L22
MKAILKTYRQSPRKVRLVANLVRGKRVDKALESLNFLTKRASAPIEKLLRSAMANARNNFNKNGEDLFIKHISVDKGATMKRFLPRARGRASRINKRTSHIRVELSDIF